MPETPLHRAFGIAAPAPIIVAHENPRFTPWGTAISTPMEVAAKMAGAEVFAFPFLAWDALRTRRHANAERAARTQEGALFGGRDLRV